jgi:mycothiol system anti-sigma-R factor
MPEPMKNLDQSHMKQDCANKKECMEMLQLILDGEATPEQKDDFLKNHLDDCMPCYKNYHLELKLRELLKTKCCGGGCPDEIAANIKSQINNGTR